MAKAPSQKKEMQDTIGLVEAAYRIDLSLEGWLGGLVAAAPDFHTGVVYAATPGEELAIRGTHLEQTSPFFNRDEQIAQGNMELPLSLWLSPGPLYASLRQRLRQLYGEEAAQQMLDKLPWPPGVQDIVAMVAIDPSGNTIVLGTHRDRPAEPAKEAELVRWSHAGAHIMAGLRLRDAAEVDSNYQQDGDAVLEPDGRCVHAEGSATSKSARSTLRDAALAMDRARGSLRRKDAEEALAIWRGLVAGRWSLVDRFDSDGRRFLVARRNEPSVSDPRGLSLRERQVVAYARLGHSNKLIAYTLGLAPSTVATHLSRALHKLGLDSRVALTQIPDKVFELPPE